MENTKLTRRTIYDVTVEELEWLKTWETKGDVPRRMGEKLFTNFHSRMTFYEQENAESLQTLYAKDYQVLFDRMNRKQTQEELIDWVLNYKWEEATFIVVMGNQLVEVWLICLIPMTHDAMRGSFQAVIDYVQLGIRNELRQLKSTEKHGINLGQALAYSNAEIIVNTAIKIAIEKKKKGRF